MKMNSHLLFYEYEVTGESAHDGRLLWRIQIPDFLSYGAPAVPTILLQKVPL
jgi:hypothetical protein